MPIAVNADDPETEFFIVVKFADNEEASVAVLKYYFSADSELQVSLTNYNEDVVATTNLETRQWVQRP